jgi:recombination protein RecA
LSILNNINLEVIQMSRGSKKNSDKNQMQELKTNEERAEALQRTMEGIEKDFGKGAIMKLGESYKGEDIAVIQTGALSLDIALGVGGLPKGRIIEVYGPESSGKTTLALHVVSEVQKQGGVAGYIDAEHALDPLYAKKLGVNIDELYISQPDDGEQGLEIAEAMVRSCAIDIVIVDSVAALTPRAEIEGEMGDSHMGLQARLMSQALRKLASIANKTNCTIIFINQLRDKIGISFGSPETTTGGRALRFYASVRLDIRRIEGVKVGDTFVGNRTRVKVAKNKVSPPFKIAEFDIMFGEGISKVGDVLDLAVTLNIVNKSGAWYSYEGQKIGQGRENAKVYFKENADFSFMIENLVREHYGLAKIETKNDKDKSKQKPNKKNAKKDEAILTDELDITSDELDITTDELEINIQE